MSIEATHSELLRQLQEPRTRVLALTGRWGTGKSHLWRSVREEMQKRARETATVYVSLFGVRSTAEVRIRLVREAIAQRHMETGWMKRVMSALDPLRALAEKLHSGAAIAGDVMQLMAPSLLKGAVVVLDDMERRHADLAVDEVLGLVDEYVNQHGARFVLIFNVDRLRDGSGTWEEFREKVVDCELRLETTPQEAFRIARGQQRQAFDAELERAVVTCGISNIRIVMRILRVAEKILANVSEPAILRRTVPSIVLVSAIHFRALEDGPDHRFVERFGHSSASPGADASVAPSPPADARQERWTSLLQALGFVGPDAFEPMIRRYLETGLVGDAELDGILAAYLSNLSRARAIERAEALKFDIQWDAAQDVPALLSRVAALHGEVHHLGPAQLDSLQWAVASLPGGRAQADALIERWAGEIETSEVPEADATLFAAPAFDLHPRITQACRDVWRRREKGMSLYAVVEKISASGNWGREQATLREAGMQEFHELLHSLDPYRLRVFVRGMTGLALSPAAAGEFAAATAAFLAACRASVAAAPDSRLAWILGRVLETCRAHGAAMGERPESGGASREPHLAGPPPS